MKKTTFGLTVTLFTLSGLAFTLHNSISETTLNPAEIKIGFSVNQLLARDSERETWPSQKKNIPILILMKEEADLTKAITLTTKAEKGAFVYQALTNTALRSQKEISALLTERKIPFKNFYIMNAIVIDRAPKELIQELAARSDVKKIIGNPTVRMSEPLDLGLAAARSDSPMTVGDNIVSTGASRVWSEFGITGQSITIAGQDTGVDGEHPALKPHYRGLNVDGSVTHDFNWHDAIATPIPSVGKKNPCGYGLSAPCDDGGHGTHTMGTMVGSDGVDNQVGMAPDAKWMACRNMDQGTGAPSTYIECFQFFLAPYAFGHDPLTEGRPDLAPHVINNSWGCPPDEGCEGREMIPVLDAMTKAGIMVVVSAGNDGSGCSTIKAQPASITDLTFSVGALAHTTNKIAYFSSRGPSKTDGGLGPDIVAPGVNIRSTIPGGNYAQTSWSGTSMAGPHVAGAVALIWSAQPKLIGKIEETVNLLRSTAIPMTSTQTCGDVPGSAIPNNTSGYGRLNVFTAVEKALKL
jgi:serine protease AprX